MRQPLPRPDLHDRVQRLDPDALDDAVEPPPPADQPLDDDAAQAQGQNWLEAMETTAVENGSDRPIDELIDDELDEDGEADDGIDRDAPIADHGAGGVSSR